MAAPVVHVEVVGKDTTTLTAFYSALFDWKIDADNPMGYGTVELAASNSGAGMSAGFMGLAGHPGMENHPGHVTFYVEVPDVESALRKVETLGGTRQMGPDQVPGGPVLGQFLDPEGHMVGVMQAGSLG
jgi:predicted enzyme related to lactoylglutathione lyase